ncbi:MULTISPECIES: alpha-amylase [unclassified Parabacteroides]|uniref:alpha-amylase n=1 Tax=unclassified Parabacteroides TaxID=2649774 RepID=UPI002472F3DD|nr:MULTISPECIES: alpha-amylase [unclassified Parabacteroides]
MENGVMMQFFEWNLPNHGKLWSILREEASRLHALGITAVWIPPAHKAISQGDAGYAAYDLYDLGEFWQKDTIRTKYGNKEELKKMIEELHKYKINVYLDAVMNHKAGADFAETFKVREVNPIQRKDFIGEIEEIEGMTGFTFPGRYRHSSFKWNWEHFTGVDYDKRTGKKGIFLVSGNDKQWSEAVDDENGNYDFLMFANLDFNHPKVADEMIKWGIWVTRELNLDGMRLDAIKHINSHFINEFLKALREEFGEQFYAVGEYWKRDVETLESYLDKLSFSLDLFDVPLHYNLFDASRLKGSYNLANLLEGTLVSRHPKRAVTFVDNHDSQKGSSLESEIEAWFKPAAYALILLMKDGYPCLFYGDYYSIGGKISPHHPILKRLVEVRRLYAYGDQLNYFDHPNTVGFVRLGDDEHPASGVALLISNGADGEKRMYVGKHRAGERWSEVTGHISQEVVIDEEGYATFYVPGGQLAVWISESESSIHPQDESTWS